MIRRAVALVVALGAAGTARADDNNVEKADKLFDEGRALMATDLHKACEKFEESLKWNSQAIGTLLNVAQCDAKLGRVASAMEKYAEARDRAREGNMAQHLKAAEEQLQLLAPRVPHVQLKLTAPPLPGTKIVIDDKVVAVADIAEKVPVDPGEHTVVVSAPERVPFETKFTVAEGEQRDVTVPELGKAVTVSSKQTLGKVFVISGGATLAAGIVIGLVARHRYNAQFPEHCNPDTLECDATGGTQTESARTLGTVGTVIGGVGIAAAGVGAYLWWRARGETKDRRVGVLPQVDPTSVGVVAVGRF